MALRAGRPYAGAADLRRMELGRAHAFNSTSLRVGDLSWLGREHTHRELSLDIRIWDDGAGELIAWTYFRANGESQCVRHPRRRVRCAVRRTTDRHRPGTARLDRGGRSAGELEHLW